jgi:hypothetical protein
MTEAVPASEARIRYKQEAAEYAVQLFNPG